MWIYNLSSPLLGLVNDDFVEMVVQQNFNSRSDTVFCGVFDGHGPYGHMVAKKVRDSLPVLLCSQWKANSNSDGNENGNSTRSKNAEEGVEEDWCESLEVEETEKLPEIYLPLKKSILNAFKQMDKDLKFHSTIDCFCSGTTAVALVKQVTLHAVFSNRFVFKVPSSFSYIDLHTHTHTHTHTLTSMSTVQKG